MKVWIVITFGFVADLAGIICHEEAWKAASLVIFMMALLHEKPSNSLSVNSDNLSSR